MAVLSDWDTIGLDVLFAAEIESGRSDQNGGTSLFTRTSGGGGRVVTGSIVDGSLAYDGANDFDRFMYLATPILRWNDFNPSNSITDWHAANSDALLYLTADVGGVPVTYSSTQTLISGGTAWFNFNATAEFWDAVSAVVQGTHFVIGMARAGRVPTDHTADAGDVAFTFAVAEPAITKVNAPVDAGDIAWAFDLSEPSVLLLKTVNAGDLAWQFALPEPRVTKTGSHVVNAGDLGWAFALPEPRVTKTGSHVVNAGDLGWAFALPEPSVTKTGAHIVNAGGLGWAFGLAEPSVTKSGSHVVNAGDLAWQFALPEPLVSITSAHAADAGDVAWSFDLAVPRVTLNKSVNAGDAAWSFDLVEPRVSIATTQAVGAGAVAWSFDLAEPLVSKTISHTIDAAEVEWNFDLPEPSVTRFGPVAVAAGGIDWRFAIQTPRVTNHERMIRTSRGARRRMTHRASTERPVPTGAEDPYGNAVTSITNPLTDHPCYWQAQSERVVRDSSKHVSIAEHLILFPLGTDVQERDQIISITDRRGRPLKSTRLGVLPVLRREDHIEAEAKEID